MTPEGITLRQALAEAWEHNDRSLVSPGFAAVAVHHFSGWARQRPLPLRVPLRFAGRAGYAFVRNVYGIELPAAVRLGRRFRVAHAGGIVVHPNTVFGDDCLIRQNVTVGAAGNGDFEHNHPTFGDRVDIGAGAVVMGPVRIGDDVTIGPNAVVMTDVPSGTVVVSPQPRRMRLPGRQEPAVQPAVQPAGSTPGGQAGPA
ncbi:serine O-acetyltransferase [Kineococcus indalonis]|uniref:serine O-acetyltransferase n=1 Tax=Kineococcus indalonis TaxID=2696566 RepID=UPI0014126346|nr:serine acetyltransferase [Kineococcus indalonis]NAZ87052.1 serine acetyltransferase [Kineococcus indalonis]